MQLQQIYKINTEAYEIAKKLKLDDRIASFYKTMLHYFERP